MQSLDYPNTEEKRRGRKKAPERERECHHTSQLTYFFKGKPKTEKLLLLF